MAPSSSQVAESVLKMGLAESDDPSQKSIVLNSTAEFCRTLGDIPTYGMSGNRDEEAEELMASVASVELLRASFLGVPKQQ